MRTLIEFDLGMLSATELSAVGNHVLLCEACAKVLDGVQSSREDDPVVRHIKRCMELPSPTVEPACIEMMAAARAINHLYEEPTHIAGSTAHAPGVGDLVGRYELREKIGRGGMGVVYRARQIPLNRQVALKMILGGAHTSELIINRFLQEGRAIARLRHNNIVQIYDLGDYEGQPFLVMELVEGGSLHAKLARGPLGPREAAELMRTLALAVAYAHEEGIIHRDLNPANILLTKDGVPKIADFGLAKLLYDDRDSATTGPLTETGAILGTASYMAPEQAEGQPAAVGPAADVYALGAIFYETLVGQPPFVAKTKLKILDLVRTAAPVPPSHRRPGVPFRLESICLKCLEKLPARRYSTARALADDLDRYLRGERPQGVPSIPRRLLRLARRHLAAILMGLAVIAAGAAAHVGDPGRPLRRMQGELALGRTVTLVGDRGEPEWSRWLAGESRSWTTSDGEDGFTINSWTLCLLELVPDPQTTSYRFAARVKHRKSDPLGEVGLFFGRRSYSRSPADLHSFGQLSFNSVRGDADIRQRFADPELFRNRPIKPNVAMLRTHFHSDEAAPPYLDFRMPGFPGPRFAPEGEDNGTWHNLEVTVTPDLLTAGWDGQQFAATAIDIRDATQKCLESSSQKARDLLARDITRTYTPRGGLGLYVFRGSASFRDVTLTPLDRVPH